MKLVATIVEVPREWLPQLPGEWSLEVWEIASDTIYEDCVVGRNPIDDDEQGYLYRVHVPAGAGLPVSLAPKDGTEVSARFNKRDEWHTAIFVENEDAWAFMSNIDDRTSWEFSDRAATAWLPLPGCAE